MTDTIVAGKLVWQAQFDAKDATRAADKYDDALERVQKQQEELTKAEKQQAKASKALREEVLRLGRAELEAGADKKALAMQARVARQALREQAEATRDLRVAQQSLAAQERALNNERARTVRLEREHAANIRATASARARSARADDRMRSVLQRQGAVGGNIEELQASIAELDKQLAGLGPGRVRRGFNAAMSGGLGGGQYVRRNGRWEDQQGRWVEPDEVFNAAAGRAGKRLAGSLPGIAMGAGRLAGGLVAGTGGAVAGIARAGGEFESLRASLGTALKTDQGGTDAAFAQVRQFAKETPFAVKEVVQAVTTLRVRGLEPTVESAMEALKTYGDVAGAMGKDLPTVIEAVSDAATGEFERLKEAFNVTAHKSGDEVKLTFNGVTTTVKNNAEEITGYLKSIGQQNFAGGMEKQAKTLGGVWSNLGDAVMVFADEVYRSGLGDALKEVLGDITGNVEGADSLAKVVGENLATAVRDAYEWFKELLGPTDELPEKFQAAWDTGKQFVSMVGSIVSAGAELAKVLAEDGLALVALAGAAGALMAGPFGAIAGAALAIGGAIGTALAEGDAGMSRLQATLADFRHQVHVEEMRQRQEDANKIKADLEATAKRSQAALAAGDRVARAELRALGVTTAAEAAALPEAEKARIRQMRNHETARFDSATLSGSTELRDQQARADAFAQAREARADQSEFDRLSKIPRKRRTVAQEKRLKEVAASLGVKTPTGGGAGKEKLSAVEAEQKSIIEKESKEAGLRAADAARLSGRGADAVRLGREAEAATKERLKAQAARGENLPGQVNTAFARIAGYGDVTQAPPPPVFVQNNKIEIQVPMKVEGNFTGDPAQIGEIAAAHLEDVLETKVYPAVAQLLQPGFHR